MTLFMSTAWNQIDEKDVILIIKKLIENDIKNIELSGGVKYQPKIKKQLMEIKTKYYTNFIIHNYFPPPENEFILNIASPVESERLRSLQFIKDGIELANHIKSPLYTFHAGYTTKMDLNDKGYFLPNSDYNNDLESGKKNLYSALNKLKEIAKDKKVRLGVENLFPHDYGKNYSLLTKPEEIFNFLERYRENDYVGLLLDLGHLNVSSFYLDFDKEKMLDELVSNYRDKVFEIHLSNNDGQKDSHDIVKRGDHQIETIKNYNLTDIPIVIESKNLTFSEFKKIENNLRGV